MPNTRQGLGVSYLPDGAEYYKACLKWHTSLDITPEEVHQKGLDEVDRIAKEIEKVYIKVCTLILSILSFISVIDQDAHTF